MGRWPPGRRECVPQFGRARLSRSSARKVRRIAFVSPAARAVSLAQACATSAYPRCSTTYLAAVKPATIVKADAAHKKDPKFSGTVEEAGRGVSMEFAEYGQKQLAIFARLHAVSHGQGAQRGERANIVQSHAR